MHLIVRLLTLVYIALAGCTGVALAGPWLPLPLALLVLLTLASVAAMLFQQGKFDYCLFGWPDLLLALMLCLWLASGIAQYNQKSLQYAVMYLAIFGAGFWMLKLMLYAFSDLRQVLWANLLGVLLLTGFATLDAVLWQFLHVDLQEMYPRVKEASAIYATVFRRAYSLASEPTVFAFYLNALGPLALWQLWRRTGWPFLVQAGFTMMIFLAWLAALSIAAIVFMALAFTVTACIWYLDGLLTRSSARAPIRRTTPGYGVMSAATVAVLGGLIVVQGVSTGTAGGSNAIRYVQPLVAKLALDDTSGSARQRTERWGTSFSIIQEKPFLGAGTGYFSSRDESSSINWYLFVGAEAGSLAMTAALAFIALSIWKVITQPLAWRWAALLGAIAGGLHFSVIGTAQHPALWILLAVHSVASVRARQRAVAR
jgi:hypothetical protein